MRKNKRPPSGEPSGHSSKKKKAEAHKLSEKDFSCAAERNLTSWLLRDDELIDYLDEKKFSRVPKDEQRESIRLLMQLGPTGVLNEDLFEQSDFDRLYIRLNHVLAQSGRFLNRHFSHLNLGLINDYCTKLSSTISQGVEGLVEQFWAAIMFRDIAKLVLICDMISTKDNSDELFKVLFQSELSTAFNSLSSKIEWRQNPILRVVYEVVNPTSGCEHRGYAFAMLDILLEHCHNPSSLITKSSAFGSALTLPLNYIPDADDKANPATSLIVFHRLLKHYVDSPQAELQILMPASNGPEKFNCTSLVSILHGSSSNIYKSMACEVASKWNGEAFSALLDQVDVELQRNFMHDSNQSSRSASAGLFQAFGSSGSSSSSSSSSQSSEGLLVNLLGIVSDWVYMQVEIEIPVLTRLLLVIREIHSCFTMPTPAWTESNKLQFTEIVEDIIFNLRVIVYNTHAKSYKTSSDAENDFFKGMASCIDEARIAFADIETHRILQGLKKPHIVAIRETVLRLRILSNADHIKKYFQSDKENVIDLDSGMDMSVWQNTDSNGLLPATIPIETIAQCLGALSGGPQPSGEIVVISDSSDEDNDSESLSLL